MKTLIAMSVAVAAFFMTPTFEGGTVTLGPTKAQAHHSKKRRSSGIGRGSGRVYAVVDKSSQRMNVYLNGRRLYTWKVSTGRKGYGTPTGTWSVKRTHKMWYSRKYNNSPMPYSMFYHGGFAIHGTSYVKRLGRPASHGCIRLHTSNAAKLYSLVRRHGGTVKVHW